MSDDVDVADLRLYATKDGASWAQRELGKAYASGSVLPKDATKAAEWWHRAAEQGDAEAQWRLGDAYEWGRGVPRSEGEALTWYRRAAEQGNADAQNHLGWLYSSGLGVQKDAEKAAHWWHLAAEQDHPTANAHLRAAHSKEQDDILRALALAGGLALLFLLSVSSPDEGVKALDWVVLLRIYAMCSHALLSGIVGILGSARLGWGHFVGLPSSAVIAFATLGYWRAGWPVTNGMLVWLLTGFLLLVALALWLFKPEARTSRYRRAATWSLSLGYVAWWIAFSWVDA